MCSTAAKATSDEARARTKHMILYTRIAMSMMAINGLIAMRYFFCACGDDEQGNMTCPTRPSCIATINERRSNSIAACSTAECDLL